MRKSSLIRIAVTLVIAIIGIVLLLEEYPINPIKRKNNHEIEIIDVVLSSVDSRPTIDAVLWNKHNKTLAITSIEITLYSRAILACIRRTYTYELGAKIAIADSDSGTITGYVSPLGLENSIIQYSLTGTCTYTDSLRWTLTVSFPIREEIASNEHLSLLFIFPDTLEVINENLPKKAPYVFDDSQKKFDFLKFT